MRRLYWRIYYAIERFYIKRKYAHAPNEIIYDPHYKYYIHPELPGEAGSVDYIASELTRSGLIYEYYIKGELTHEHHFEGVLLAAYNEAEHFKLKDDPKQYSPQQIELITKLQQRKLNEKTL